MEKKTCDGVNCIWCYKELSGECDFDYDKALKKKRQNG
jgi:hypothetical protein